MKMMDNVAGIVAFRHAQCNIVTASIGKIHAAVGYHSILLSFCYVLKPD
jgi:acyl-CoA hydrolase